MDYVLSSVMICFVRDLNSVEKRKDIFHRGYSFSSTLWPIYKKSDLLWTREIYLTPDSDTHLISASLSGHQTDMMTEVCTLLVMAATFLISSKVLSKTLAYITSSIRQTYFSQARGREAPVKKWRKYRELGLSWPCYSLRDIAGSGVQGGMSDAGKAERPAHKAHTVHLFMLFMSCIPLPIVSIHSLSCPQISGSWWAAHIVIVATFKHQSVRIDILTISEWFVHAYKVTFCRYFSKHPSMLLYYVFSETVRNKIKCQQNASWC